MKIAFLYPWILLGLALLPLLWFAPGALRQWKHTLLRTILIGLLLFGIAQPASISQNELGHFVFILDDSPTAVPLLERSATALAKQIAKLPSDAHVSVIHFGAANIQESLNNLARPIQILRIEDPASHSPLSEALATAERLLPSGSRAAVTLFTDGRATDQRWAAPLQSLGHRGIPLHCVELPAPQNVYPFSLQSPQSLRVGETARIQVGIAGTGTGVHVRLLKGGQLMAEQQGIDVTRRTHVVFEFEPKEAGFVSLKAEILLSSEDSAEEVRSLSRMFPVQDPLRVLYAGRRLKGARPKFEKTVGPGFHFTSFPTAAVPAAESLIDNADLVVLDDLPAAAISKEVQTLLAQAVSNDGLGMLMSGGMAAFGPGGYHKTPLADILPIDFIQKEEKRDPSTTLVVIIDTSGSMTGPRVQLAKEVARLSMRRLLPHDKVGIVEFYGAKRWAAPIQPASNSIELQRAINRLDAGGGTVILPAIEEAFYALQNVQTRYKHVLVLTDGGVEQGAFEPLLRRMANKSINVSTVLVGGDAHSEFLVSLANWGKGRFYSASNRFSLPEVILKQPTTARIPAYRPGRHELTTHGGPGWWGTVDRASLPRLAGYVESQLKPRAESIIRTQEGQHPVLASWHHGLGRVSVFTSEPMGPGTAPWQDWSDYGAMLGRVLRRTARSHATPFDFDLQRRDDRVTLTARRLMKSVEPVATVVEHDEPVKFRQLSPDMFQATFFHDPSRPLRMIAGARGAEASWRLCSAAYADVAAEFQVDPDTAAPIAKWSRDTSGNHVALSAADRLDVTLGGAPSSIVALEFWPYAILIALLLYLTDLLVRRWPLRSRARLGANNGT